MSRLDLFRFELGAVDDSGALQTVSGRGMPGEEFKDHHRIGFHGFGYNPPAGSHAVAIAMHGSRDRALVFGLEHADKRRRNIPAGGSCLYDAEGNVIKAFGNEGGIEFDGKPFTIKVGRFTVEADDIVLKAGSMVIRARPGRIDLGAMEAPHRVATEAGLSSKVFAVV